MKYSTNTPFHERPRGDFDLTFAFFLHFYTFALVAALRTTWYTRYQEYTRYFHCISFFWLCYRKAQQQYNRVPSDR